MGLPGFSEYEVWQTDVKNIKRASKILEECADDQGNCV